MQGRASAQKIQTWANFEKKCLAEIWDNEELQQEQSVMCRKQNIWDNIASKLRQGFITCKYKRTASQSGYKEV